MHTVGIARNPDPVIQFNHIDETVSVTQLDEVLPKIDALVLCLPLTPETDHMIGLSELQAMKKGAILINVARAGVLDYQSVVSELKNGHLGGAAIDVFEKEPLKRWSRLWGVDNLLITPHIGAVTSNYREGISDLVCDNISRYLNSQEMKNVVNRLKGY
jgi:phosphoglycerate dehydrogenase-like enzyme